jgi:hypothetical protein
MPSIGKCEGCGQEFQAKGWIPSMFCYDHPKEEITFYRWKLKKMDRYEYEGDLSYKVDLTYQDKMSIISKPCPFCGEQEAGCLAKIDWNKEYSIGNCYPCCKDCLFLLEGKSYNMFCEYIEKTYLYQKELGNIK